MLQRTAFAVLAFFLAVPACEKQQEPAGTDEKAAVSGDQKKTTPSVAPTGGTAKKETPAPAVEKTLPSGVTYTVLEEGEGPTPRLGSMVSVHVTGRLPGGQVFLDTRRHGVPREYKLDKLNMITGWVDTLTTMKKGEKRKLHVPSHLAYGSRGYAGFVPPNTDLDFEIELVSIGR